MSFSCSMLRWVLVVRFRARRSDRTSAPHTPTYRFLRLLSLACCPSCWRKGAPPPPPPSPAAHEGGRCPGNRGCGAAAAAAAASSACASHAAPSSDHFLSPLALEDGASSGTPQRQGEAPAAARATDAEQLRIRRSSGLSGLSPTLAQRGPSTRCDTAVWLRSRCCSGSSSRPCTAASVTGVPRMRSSLSSSSGGHAARVASSSALPLRSRPTPIWSEDPSQAETQPRSCRPYVRAAMVLSPHAVLLSARAVRHGSDAIAAAAASVADDAERSRALRRFNAGSALASRVSGSAAPASVRHSWGRVAVRP